MRSAPAGRSSTARPPPLGRTSSDSGQRQRETAEHGSREPAMLLRRGEQDHPDRNRGERSEPPGPDATRCSAHETRPLPPRSRRAPMVPAAAFQYSGGSEARLRGGARRRTGSRPRRGAGFPPSGTEGSSRRRTGSRIRRSPQNVDGRETRDELHARGMFHVPSVFPNGIVRRKPDAGKSHFRGHAGTAPGAVRLPPYPGRPARRDLRRDDADASAAKAGGWKPGDLLRKPRRLVDERELLLRRVESGGSENDRDGALAEALHAVGDVRPSSTGPAPG